ncbi:MAG: bifunctional diaminohydroxyphosphoribosylaminopyrimidine deaminase/5-amino-6-(5-phosphoribosylamino)uracil reductase RibD [Pseudomonadota bacterium]
MTAGHLRRPLTDEALMQLALAMARRGLGTTAPNPSVGAIVYRADLDQVVGRGVTQRGGRPHAEPTALAAAGDRARGATLAVTLEPCSHHGRSPPCVDAIIAAGIARVVVAIADPDPRVSGRGLDRLAAAGIDVVRSSPPLADAAAWITRGHILRVTERRPFVQLKIAVGADGRIAKGGDGAPRWVTSLAARADGHRLRAEADAILVGAGTVRDDDPDLTCRLPGLQSQSPLRVVVGGEAIAPAAKLAASAATVPVWHFMAHAALTDGAPGVTQIAAHEVGGRIWLPDVISRLVADGITRLLVEGGPAMWQSFAALHMVDEIVLYSATVAGRPLAPADAISIAGHYCPGLDLVVADARMVGPDARFVLRMEGAGSREIPTETETT